ESEENYVYLKANGQAAYIKPNNYERAKTRAWKNDIGRFENMTYLSDEDAYLCADGRKLTVTGTKTVKSKTGYASVKTCYKADPIHLPEGFD
ncbi:IS5/IS1182 family transposase, partial [Selenomonas sputigena]